MVRKHDSIKNILDACVIEELNKGSSDCPYDGFALPLAPTFDIYEPEIHEEKEYQSQVIIIPL